MIAKDVERLRKRLKISRLEVAANTGLPEDYIRQIEEGEVVALENDLERLKQTIHRIDKNRKDEQKWEKS
jgi:predicted transcriptional regulator